MPAPIAAWAGLALSAAFSGSKARAASTAKAEAAAIQKQKENQLYTLYELPNGTFQARPQNDMSGTKSLTDLGAKPVRTGQLNQLQYDVPAEQQNVIPLYEATTPNGETISARPMTGWSANDQLNYTIYPVGELDPLTQAKTFFPEHVVERNRNGGSVSQNDMMVHVIKHPKIGEFEGTYQEAVQVLQDNSISFTDKKLSSTLVNVSTGADGKKTLGTPSDFSFAEAAEKQTDKDEYQITAIGPDGEFKTTYFSEAGSLFISPSRMTELFGEGHTLYSYQKGKVSVDTSEFMATANPTLYDDKAGGSKSTTDSLLEAANLGELSVYFKSSDKKTIIGSKATNKVQNLRSHQTQLINRPEVRKELFDGIEANNGQAINYRDQLFARMLEEYNSTKQTEDGVVLQTYNMNMLLSEVISQGGYSGLVGIPGMAEKIKEYEDNKRVVDQQMLVAAATKEEVDAVAVTVDIPAEQQPPALSNLTGGATVQQTQTVTWPSKYRPVVTNKILPFLRKSSGMESDSSMPLNEKASLKLRQLVTYQKDSEGIDLRDAKGQRILADSQPVLEVFAEMNKIILVDATENSPAFTVFDSFNKLLDPRTPAVDLLQADNKAAVKDFVSSMPFDKAINVIAAMLPSGRGAAIAMNNKYGFGGSQKTAFEYAANQRSVFDASGRAIQIKNDAIRTYDIDPQTGEIRGDSTALGNFGLFIAGAKYLAGEAAEFIGMSKDDVVSKGQSYVAKASGMLANSGRTLLDGKTPAFKSDDLGQRMIEQDLEALSKTNHAQRGFFLLVLAYEVAAAIQGGTGGRTISDQDVALIFRGLRQNFTDDPATQVAALNGVGAVLERFRKRASMLMNPKDTVSQAAYLTAENFYISSGEDIAASFTMDGVLKELGGTSKPPGAGQQDSTLDVSTPEGQKKVLDTLNFTRRTLNLELFEDYNSIPPNIVNDTIQSMGGAL